VQGGGFVLFVAQRILIKNIDETFQQYVEKYPNFNFGLIGPTELDNLALLHPEVALAYEPGFLKQAIKGYQKRDDGKLFEQNVAAVQSAYRNSNLVLFLGAGVSKSCRDSSGNYAFPDWDELISLLFFKLIQKDSQLDLTGPESGKILTCFQDMAPKSPLILARFLRDEFGDNFWDEVRRVLYSKASRTASSPLLREIAALCTPQRGKDGILGVVTYNFDNLLENELSQRRVKYLSIISDDDNPLPNQLPIYHVHGFLTRTEAITPQQKQALVFSEEAYHSQFVDPYLWTNIRQLTMLRNNVCLFVGCSMTDPNVRRLLEITHNKKQTIRHYAILHNHWADEEAKLSTGLKPLAKIMKGLEENSLNKLGVFPIWIDNYDEIPEILRKIGEDS
jgi:hypothetical protein